MIVARVRPRGHLEYPLAVGVNPCRAGCRYGRYGAEVRSKGDADTRKRLGGADSGHKPSAGWADADEFSVEPVSIVRVILAELRPNSPIGMGSLRIAGGAATYVDR
jgi:hypothetical protein